MSQNASTNVCTVGPPSAWPNSPKLQRRRAEVAANFAGQHLPFVLPGGVSRWLENRSRGQFLGSRLVGSSTNIDLDRAQEKIWQDRERRRRRLMAVNGSGSDTETESVRRFVIFFGTRQRSRAWQVKIVSVFVCWPQSLTLVGWWCDERRWEEKRRQLEWEDTFRHGQVWWWGRQVVDGETFKREDVWIFAC